MSEFSNFYKEMNSQDANTARTPYITLQEPHCFNCISSSLNQISTKLLFCEIKYDEIAYFIVLLLVTWPLNGSQAIVDLSAF